MAVPKVPQKRLPKRVLSEDTKWRDMLKYLSFEQVLEMPSFREYIERVVPLYMCPEYEKHWNELGFTTIVPPKK